MTRVTTDDRGRITIPQEIRQEYGDDYFVVGLSSGIKLVPVPDDPLELLADVGDEASEAFKDAEIEELRADAAAAARRDARESLDDVR